MKKIILILLAVVSLTACKNSQEDKKDTETTTVTYQLNPEIVLVNWTGYKFTAKSGVKGRFENVTITNNNKAETLNEALTGVEVSIPVSSIFSNNTTRDGKLKSLFFGFMDQTEFLSAKVLSVKNNSGIIAFTMNNETHNLPFTLENKGNYTHLNATIDILKWNAHKALESLHTACELLHTGEDGISKTWNTVDVNVILNFSH